MNLRREWLKNNKKMIGKDIIYTKSTHFIMPMIGYISDNFLNFTRTYNYLINCYLDLINDKIILIVDNTDDQNIIKLLQFNKTNPNYEGFTSDDDENEIILRYNIPDEHRDDFNIFLTSKYSKMSEQYKRRLVGLYGRVTNTEDYKPTKFDILYPTTLKREQWAKHLNVDVELIDEVSPSLNMEYEQYKTIQELLPNIKQQETTEGEQV